MAARRAVLVYFPFGGRLATRLAGAGVNAYILRDVLGHRSLTMSNCYVRAAGEAFAEAVEKGAALTAEAM